jgi:hypothetical protein
MSLCYKVSYRLGFHPWEDLARALAVRLSAVVTRGPSGVWGVQLAQRGGQVTGLDNVSKALERAMERMLGW